MSGQVFVADGLATVLGADIASHAVWGSRRYWRRLGHLSRSPGEPESRSASTSSGNVHLVLGSDYALRAGVMVIPAARHGTHTLAMATPNVELFKHRVRLCRRQVLHVHAWERGVKRFLRDGFRLAPSRESGHEEAECQNETGVKEQCDGRLSAELVQLCTVLRHSSQYSIREGARRADSFLTSGTKRTASGHLIGAAGIDDHNAGTKPTSADKYPWACGRRLDLRHLPGSSVQWAGMVRSTGALLVGACGEPFPGLEPGVSCGSSLARFARACFGLGNSDEFLHAQLSARCPATSVP